MLLQFYTSVSQALKSISFHQLCKSSKIKLAHTLPWYCPSRSSVWDQLCAVPQGAAEITQAALTQEEAAVQAAPDAFPVFSLVTWIPRPFPGSSSFPSVAGFK